MNHLHPWGSPSFPTRWLHYVLYAITSAPLRTCQCSFWLGDFSKNSEVLGRSTMMPQPHSRKCLFYSQATTLWGIPKLLSLEAQGPSLPVTGLQQSKPTQPLSLLIAVNHVASSLWWDCMAIAAWIASSQCVCHLLHRQGYGPVWNFCKLFRDMDRNEGISQGHTSQNSIK